MNRTLSRISHGAAALTAATLIASAARAQLSVSEDPLFLGENVKPNILLAVDDSGSMDGEVLFSTNDGAVWWRTSAGGGCPQGYAGCGTNGTADIAAAGRPNFNHAGNGDATWKKYVYLFPIGSGAVTVGRRVYNDATNDHFAIPPLPAYAWARSPDFNAAYFNPAERYEPWQGYGSTTFGNAPPATAKTDPVVGTVTFNLTLDRMSATSVSTSTCSGTTPALSVDHLFRMYPGMVIPAGTCFRARNDAVPASSPNWQIAATDLTITHGATANAATLVTPATGSGLGVAIRYFPATFYLRSAESLPAGYGYTATPLAGTGPAGEALLGYEIKLANFANPQLYATAIGNFANWFTYYRKRHAATRGGLGFAFNDVDNTRVGSFRINNRVDVAMRDLDIAADREAFYADVYSYVNSGGTPNREAVNHMGLQLSRTDGTAPILATCQQNFGVLFTDGYSNVATPRDVDNADGTYGAPFADSYDNTMADLAMYYYQNNLRPDLGDGSVPVPAACDAASPDPRLDCQVDPHMNLFGVTLGTRGTIFGVDTAATADPFANPPAWPNPNSVFRHPAHVDDLWHGTINSRGSLLNVAIPSQVGERFAELLDVIDERESSSSAVAANSTRLETNTFVYQGRFRTSDWTGQLLALELDPDDGTIAGLAWDAADLIPDPADRNIFTLDEDGDGIEFLWDLLGSTQQGSLDMDMLGEARVDWLRGDQSLEDNEDGFRVRTAVLGDIVNSDPVFVGAQNFGYEALPVSTPGRDSYQDFRITKIDVDGTDDPDDDSDDDGRVLEPMLYVGANDGMLHAFDAETGEEWFAYVPSALIPELDALSDPSYSHRYFVDGQIAVGDAYIDRGGGSDEWASVLVGTTGAGGKTVFALDVTNPHDFDENDVLWEFTGTDNIGDPDTDDFGIPIGQPTIARTADGTWVAIFGNGYNSTNHHAVLYIVNLEDGTLLRKIDTGAGSLATPNGLATPSLLADATRTIQAAYAGDLHGNLWKFDLSNADPDLWTVAFSGSPLFTATDNAGVAQPITAPPQIGRHPNGGYMLYFGTGTFFQTGDNFVSSPQEQSFYGIWDKTAPSVIMYTDREDILTRQEILYEDDPAALPSGRNFAVRVTSNNPTDWDSARGWFIDLVSPLNGAEGERVVSLPLLRNGRVIFPTLIPSASPCEFGGASWLMEIEAVSGKRLDQPPLDINEDGDIDSEDLVTVTIDGVSVTVAPSAIQSREGIIDTPAVLTTPDGNEIKVASGTSGNVEALRERGSGQRLRGSWRQLR
jgi:type IV pilus assembly protein PilY1